MALLFNPIQLKALVEKFSYSNFGDHYEKNFASMMNGKFPNSEVFWKFFVVPMTKRIVSDDVNDQIRPRESVSIDIQSISTCHYSIFLNIIYADDCLKEKQLGFFENFYAHLATICDLTDDFFLKLFTLRERCYDRTPKGLNKLSKEDFISVAESYYTSQYEKDYLNYFSKGKITPQRLISARNVLEDYFQHSFKSNWTEYKKLSQNIRTYRNVIIHNSKVGSLINSENNSIFVPKKEYIGHFKDWKSISNVTPKDFSLCFVDQKSLMSNDLSDLMKILNELWWLPIIDIKKLIYEEKNKKILDLFDIEFSEDLSNRTLPEINNDFLFPISGSTVYSKSVNNTDGNSSGSYDIGLFSHR